MTPTELVYRKSAAEGASGFGLLMALYDTLAGDLRRAAEAERRGNIEKRCREVKHALLVIGFLEDRINQGSSGDLADKLATFYKALRRKLIEAQAKQSPEIIEEQMTLVLNLRGTWQDLEHRAADTLDASSAALTPMYSGTLPAPDERSALSWSA
jgi:flagellar protein FliS